MPLRFMVYGTSKTYEQSGRRTELISVATEINTEIKVKDVYTSIASTILSFSRSGGIRDGKEGREGSVPTRPKRKRS